MLHFIWLLVAEALLELEGPEGACRGGVRRIEFEVSNKQRMTGNSQCNSELSACLCPGLSNMTPLPWTESTNQCAVLSAGIWIIW